MVPPGCLALTEAAWIGNRRRGVLGVAATICALLLAALALTGAFVASPAAAHHDDAEVGEYIVLFQDWVEDPEALAIAQVEQHDGQLGFIYKHALKGYSAYLSWGAVKALRNESSVREISPEYSAGPATIDRQWATGITKSDATLHAEINGDDLLTHYELQIDTTGNFRFYQTSSCPLSAAPMICLMVIVPGDPLPPGLVQPPEFMMPASHDSRQVSVNMAEIGATLQPDTTYFYRAIATNGRGLVEGPTETFTTPLTDPSPVLVPAEITPAATINASINDTAPAAALPSSRPRRAKHRSSGRRAGQCRLRRKAIGRAWRRTRSNRVAARKLCLRIAPARRLGNDTLGSEPEGNSRRPRS